MDSYSSSSYLDPSDPTYGVECYTYRDVEIDAESLAAQTPSSGCRYIAPSTPKYEAHNCQRSTDPAALHLTSSLSYASAVELLFTASGSTSLSVGCVLPSLFAFVVVASLDAAAGILIVVVTLDFT
ncbi:unnamed protein product [Citrullus colocynthis]|uniref:Uncharacterized protein n=1 Tax=Citrullus colocynthis TaxID=252529 RepID=A0ABP0XM39_9ROSI